MMSGPQTAEAAQLALLSGDPTLQQYSSNIRSDLRRTEDHQREDAQRAETRGWAVEDRDLNWEREQKAAEDRRAHAAYLQRLQQQAAASLQEQRIRARREDQEAANLREDENYSRRRLDQAADLDDERRYEEEQATLEHKRNLEAIAARGRGKKSGGSSEVFKSFESKEIDPKARKYHALKNLADRAARDEPAMEGFGSGLPGVGSARLFLANKAPAIVELFSDEAVKDATWWADFTREWENRERKDVFGATLTNNEQIVWDRGVISGNMTPEQRIERFYLIQKYSAWDLGRSLDYYMGVKDLGTVADRTGIPIDLLRDIEASGMSAADYLTSEEMMPMPDSLKGRDTNTSIGENTRALVRRSNRPNYRTTESIDPTSGRKTITLSQ
jgi:hypothetical protein